jgi:uncharacterized protein (TIGR00255 family)
MTGFGSAEFLDKRSTRYVIEIKSLNQRFLDVQVKAPRELSSLEWHIRKAVSAKLGRGKIEVSILKSSAQLQKDEAPGMLLNRDLLSKYLESYRAATSNAIAHGYSMTPSELTFLLSQPGVFLRDIESNDLDESEKEDLLNVFAQSLEDLYRSRHDEGVALQTILVEILEQLTNNLTTVRTLSQSQKSETEKMYRDKIKQVFIEQHVPIDESRLMQEVFYLCDRLDISEEISRLDSHLALMNKKLTQGGRIGRELDFLCQEIAREWNTIGSKSSNIAIVSAVLEAKASLEKIREQVQNIE